MTYCLALKMNDGMVFASDSRTNAGVDQIACFKKMRTYSNDTDRVIVTMSSGNLSITQSAFNLLEQRANDPNVPNLWNAKTLFDVASLLGDCMREVRKESSELYTQNAIDMGANFIVGGQVKGEAPRLFMIYAEGNFIEATEETPFFQIGETKYGKPVLDRFIRPETTLSDAIKCAMVSFDSTIRSNISVGLPIDLVSMKKDSFSFDEQHHITEDDAYFTQISSLWREGLTSLFAGLPEPESNTQVVSNAQPPQAEQVQSNMQNVQPPITHPQTQNAPNNVPPVQNNGQAPQNVQPIQNQNIGQAQPPQSVPNTQAAQNNEQQPPNAQPPRY